MLKKSVFLYCPCSYNLARVGSESGGNFSDPDPTGSATLDNILPYYLYPIPSLLLVQVEGNPMKTIRRDILARGTAGLLKYLRSRHTIITTPVHPDPALSIENVGSESGIRTFFQISDPEDKSLRIYADCHFGS